ncbi:MAG: phosphoribosyl-AMP cyclohydrolase [Thermodesulfobacteriota bacterium]
MEGIDFEKCGGLVPVVVQDCGNGEVLMLAYMNREAWEKTKGTGRACYWSRSRNQLWMKGEISGHYQVVREILIDCDGDALLLKVEQHGGGACHTGYRSCFHRSVHHGKVKVVGQKVFDPEEVYGK